MFGVAAVFVVATGAFLAYRAWDPGLGGDHTAWEQVFPELRGANQTCTYDRANVGASDGAPTPRTSADVVADLHGLLEAAGIPAPNVLVGHSFGGISMQLYASTYADAAAGLVLVDPTPTTFVDDACAIVDATGHPVASRLDLGVSS